MGAAFLSVNLVVATLFYQKAESLSFFYLRNLLYLIGNILKQFPLAIGFIRYYRHPGTQLGRFQHFLSGFYVMHVSG
jgi:hypothetical protein